jgi:hypothetical protein
MKTRIVLLTLAILASSFAFANNPVKHETTTDCEKKVLKKIKRKMYHLNVKDYLDEGEKRVVIITCLVNPDNSISVARISGTDQEVTNAIVETMEEHPVICKNAPVGEYFTFKMVLQHYPAL